MRGDLRRPRVASGLDDLRAALVDGLDDPGGASGDGSGAEQGARQEARVAVRGLLQHPPAAPDTQASRATAPAGVTDLDRFRVRRRDRIGGVIHEYRLVAQVIGTHSCRPVLTREAVFAAVCDATYVHFNCHASSDPAEPSGSVHHLPSGHELPVLEIRRIQPRSARLAFLAACGTSSSPRS